jgi:hypothetical protein
MNVVALLSNSLERYGGMLLPLPKVSPFLITACVSSSSETRCWRLSLAAYYRILERHASIWRRSVVSLTLIIGGGGGW